MIILGIETSCDETAAAILVIKSQSNKAIKFNILSNIVSSQVDLHAKYGGVVPEVAARAHIQCLIPIINEAMEKGIKGYKEISGDIKGIDAIAVTKGPGLISSLMIGVDTARTLAYVWKKPILGINHIEAHIYSNLLTTNNQQPTTNLRFPALCLVVSGGHTLLILMRDHGKYKILGSTRDDAAGEAFDKVAKLLNIGYPGGPIIEKLSKKGNPKAFHLPRPMIGQKNFDFSFSGLKTAVIDGVRSQKSKLHTPPPPSRQGGPLVKSQKFINDLCASFQQAVVDVLVEKTIRAAKKYKVKTVMLGGGVAANKLLRKTLKWKVNKELHATCHMPRANLCMDNATMVAIAGYYHALRKKFDNWKTLQVDANLKLK